MKRITSLCYTLKRANFVNPMRTGKNNTQGRPLLVANDHHRIQLQGP